MPNPTIQTSRVSILVGFTSNTVKLNTTGLIGQKKSTGECHYKIQKKQTKTKKTKNDTGYLHRQQSRRRKGHEVL